MSENKEIQYVLDESLKGDLHYKESVGDDEKGPYRNCDLWKSGVDKPVSSLRFYSFEQRFGIVSVPVEGIGNVNTDVAHRQKGYISILMKRALAGMADRVDAAFLFGIGGLYGKFGFVTCQADSELTLWVKRAENLVIPDTFSQDTLTDNDVPAINALFNAEHGTRPWTRLRTKTIGARLLHNQAWRPGPELLSLKENGKIRAYAAINGHGFGWGRAPYFISEAIADSPESARALLCVFRDRALARGVDSIKIGEPLDSTIGRTVHQLGGEYSSKFGADNGAMGAILNRPSLVEALAAELDRRLGGKKSPKAAVAALSTGELIQDDKVLMQLLTGYWSWEDALHAGEKEPEEYRDIVRGWFPGGGTRVLPEPYSHNLDGY